MKILMVCLGNICRSPLAEGLLRHKLEEKNIKGVTVDSAGTSGYHAGDPPDHRTRENARKHGINLDNLVSRQFTARDFELFDRIYVMDHNNLEDVLSLAGSPIHKEKVNLLLNCMEEGCDLPVPDPYFGGEEGFEKVFHMVERAVENLVAEIERELNERS